MLIFLFATTNISINIILTSINAGKREILRATKDGTNRYD